MLVIVARLLKFSNELYLAVNKKDTNEINRLHDQHVLLIEDYYNSIRGIITPEMVLRYPELIESNDCNITP